MAALFNECGDVFFHRFFSVRKRKAVLQALAICRSGGRSRPGVSARPNLGLGNFVLPNKMLNEIVPPIASVGAFPNVAGPGLQLSMPLILMPDPIGLALERLGIVAVRKRTSKRLNIFVYVFGPVRRFLELLHLETIRAFKLGGKELDWRIRHTLRKLCRHSLAITIHFHILF